MRDFAEVELPAESGRPLSILIVDDDPDVRSVLHRMLSRPHWTVDEAEDGPLALRQFTTGRFDFVLTDIEMPGMNGCEFVEQLRGVERDRGDGRHATILALSAHDDPAVQRLALDSGCDHYLTKPPRREALLALVLNTAPQDGDDDTDVRALMPAFLAAKQDELRQLADAFERGDAEAVRHLSHRMRGSFALYGFTDAGNECAGIEGLAKPESLANAGERLPLLYRHMDAIRARFDEPTVEKSPK